MSDISKCPKCGGDLKLINESMAKFDCVDCHQRMDIRDYITFGIKNFHVRIEMDPIFVLVFDGVNKD